MKNESQISNRVIVLGGSHHNGLGIIRSLGEVGCRVFFISIGTKTNKNFVTKSKYIEDFWYSNSENDLLKILLQEFGKDKLKPIIFPSDDNTAAIIDKNFNKLDDKFIVPTIDKQENAILKKMNKQVMFNLAEENGFLVPKSCTVNISKIENIQVYLDKHNIGLPCIVKPIQSVDGSKTDITVSHNTAELKKNLLKLKDSYTEVIIQEFINKDGELGFQGLVTINKQEVIIPGVIEKIRDSSVARGSTTYAKLVKSNSLVNIESIKSFISSLQFKGIFDLELIYSKGRIYFIELNFRNGAYGYAYTSSGVNIPELLCLDAIGKDISKEQKKISRELTLMSEIADFRNVICKKIGFFKWLKQFLTVDIYLIFNKKDINPFIYKFIYR